MKTLFRTVSLLFVLILMLSAVGPASASDSTLELYGGGDEADGLAVDQPTFHVFYDVTRTFPYSGGPVCLSSQPGQCAPAAIDDYIVIWVNGQVVVDQRSYATNFGPVNFAPFLEPGDNQIRVQLIDLIGPRRGGSQLWLVPGEGSETGMLQVNSVRKSQGGYFILASMGAPYTMEVEVHNPTSSPLTGTVHLEESGNVGGGDSLSAPREQSVTLAAGETRYVTFDNYVHKWSWLEGVTNKCLDAGEIIASVAFSVFGKFSTLINQAGNVKDFIGFADDSKISASRHKFDYHAYVVTNAQSSPRVATSVWVDVPYNKMGDFGLYFLEQMGASTIIGSGFLAQSSPQSAWASQSLINMGMQMQVASCYSFESATDPDPNYTEIAVPEPIMIDSIQDDGEYQQVSLDGLTYLSIQRALYQTTARYEGARAANDGEWMEIQGRVARRYLVHMLYALDAWDSSSAELFAAVRGTDWHLSPEEVMIARDAIVQQGLSATQVEFLQQMGFDADEINAMPGLWSSLLESDEEWPRLTLPGDMLAPILHQMIDGVNSDLAELNGAPIDTIPPTSSIQLEGTMGKNDWFVSDVTVTLAALDDASGSGLASIEWSLDNGRTWSIYNGPFVHSEEGIFHLLVRATDQEGNIEYPPVESDFKVDKTPPIVNVWTDQTQYTRVQLFLIHYSGYDPEPGSGLATLTAVFNSQPVTNGQSVDMFWWNLGTYTLTATGEDYAGWVTTESQSIQLIATIESLQQTVQRLCQEGYITKSGICNSLRSKLNSALAAQQRGQNRTAVNIVLAFQNEIRAQTDKSISAQAKSILMMDSNFVISKLGGR